MLNADGGEEGLVELDLTQTRKRRTVPGDQELEELREEVSMVGTLQPRNQEHRQS